MLVSIIVPVYNVEKYLAVCVDSILAQDTATPYEILLVDDGSTDRSGAICDEYAAAHAQVRVFHKPNGGVSSARNVGIDAAQGTYIFFVDSDDLIRPQFLSTFDALLASKPDMALCGNTRFETDPDIDEVVEKLPIVPSGESGEAYLAELFAAKKAMRPYPWGVAFRRSLLNEHGLRFREDLPVGEDFELLLRCYPLAERVCGTDKPLYCYRLREGSLAHSFAWEKIKADLQTKAAAYRTYPNGVMADQFAWYAIEISRAPNEKTEAVRLLRDNRDILKHTMHPPLRVYYWMTVVLGPWQASRLYLFLRNQRDALRERRKKKHS